jgi:LPXTG-site transpeptidase (sortase) family protein
VSKAKFKKKYPLKLKVLPMVLAALLVSLIFLLYDFGMPLIEKRIDPPKRDISHDNEPGQITEFNLTIEKLKINVPVIPNVDGKNEEIYNDALNNGVAHYKNTALPNSGSNIVIFGHSSAILGMGRYADIFANLDNLDQGDEIKLIFNQKEYLYLVSEINIIAADDFSLVSPTERERLTLLTCWPIGTADKRLVIISIPKN